MTGKRTPSGKPKTAAEDGLTQSERFIKAAQELGTDDDPERFKEQVRRLTRASNAKHPAARTDTKKPDPV